MITSLSVRDRQTGGCAPTLQQTEREARCTGNSLKTASAFSEKIQQLCLRLFPNFFYFQQKM